uniref:Uncharacterized protein n=1 Tax=Opuntia streptacantha TaxID=393608 RepID=A0A7C9E9K6_OPUST
METESKSPNDSLPPSEASLSSRHSIYSAISLALSLTPLSTSSSFKTFNSTWGSVVEFRTSSAASSGSLILTSLPTASRVQSPRHWANSPALLILPFSITSSLVQSPRALAASRGWTPSTFLAIF